MVALGVVLIVVAVLLLVGEAHLSTGGFIGSGAVVALVGGLALVLAGAGAGTAVVLLVALAAATVSVAGLLVFARNLIDVRLRLPRSGAEAMVGRVGVIRSSRPDTRVYIDGGLWRGRLSLLEEEDSLHDGDPVVVERVNGLTLCVRKAEEWELTQ
jgi:membrane-bound ClpP family serine protease